MGKENYAWTLKKIINTSLSIKDIRLLLLELISNSHIGEINKISIRKVGYICNNLHHYRMSVIDNVEFSIEAIQAHYIAKELKRRRKGFKIRTLGKVLKILCSQVNGFFGQEAWYKKEYVNLGLFGRTGKNIPLFQYDDSGSRTYQLISQLIKDSDPDF